MSVIVISLRVNCRAMLVPAAAVVPAPKAYGKGVFFQKKHVVGFLPMTYATPPATFPNPCCPGRWTTTHTHTRDTDMHAIPHTTHHLTPSSLRVSSVSQCLCVCSLRGLSCVCPFLPVVVSLSLFLFCLFSVSICLIFHSFVLVSCPTHERGAATSIEDITRGTIWSNSWEINLTEMLLPPSAGISLTAPFGDSRCCLCSCLKMRALHWMDQNSALVKIKIFHRTGWLFTATPFKAFFFFFKKKYLFWMFGRENATEAKRSKGHDS